MIDVEVLSILHIENIGEFGSKFHLNSFAIGPIVQTKQFQRKLNISNVIFG